MEAAAVWVLFPGEIAADLRRVYGVRIADWHQGRMSSYEFLELIEYLPEDSLFKTGLRGEPCERDEQIRQITNEITILRAGMVEGANSEMWGPRLFIPPRVQKAAEKAEDESEDAREGIFAQAQIGT